MIDWSKAPEWANYVAMDKNGDWYWHEKKPSINGNWWGYSGNQELAFSLHWNSSLVERSPSPAELNTMDCQGGQ